MQGTAVRPREQDSRARLANPVRPNRWFLLGSVSIVLLGVVVHYLRFDLRSYALLKRFLNPQATGILLKWETRVVKIEDVTIPTAGVTPLLFEPPDAVGKFAVSEPSGAVRARLYWPLGVRHPGGMVVVHGIHHLGMEEPRLVNFARAVAGSGLAVLTPQVDSLADYHVDASSIAVIGESAAWLDERLGNHRVMVSGISFAGGLALLAATDPGYESHMRALMLIGVYDDLARVARFLATGLQELPDGRTEAHPAHDYGAAVFVYAHLNQFFPAGDLPVAHEALKAWLWEEPERAKPLLDQLSPVSRATMNALLERRVDQVRAQMLNAVHTDEVELATISPRGHVAHLRVPVYLLHGSADDIIPPAESLWLEQDLPRQEVRHVLISEAFSHVDLHTDVTFPEQLRLVHFMAEVLRAAN